MNIVLLGTMMVSYQCCENKSRSFPKDAKAYLSIHFLLIVTCYQGHRNTPTIVPYKSITYSHSHTMGSLESPASLMLMFLDCGGRKLEHLEKTQSQREHSNLYTQRPEPESNPESLCSCLVRQLLTTVKLSFFKWPLWDETNKINTSFIALKLFFLNLTSMTSTRGWITFVHFCKAAHWSRKIFLLTGQNEESLQSDLYHPTVHIDEVKG